MTRALRARTDRFDAGLIATVVALCVGVFGTIAVPSFPDRIIAPALDLALDSIALVVTACVSLLAWVRFREAGHPFALYQSAAFATLAIANLRAVLVTIGSDVTSPLARSEPGQDQLYVFTVARAITAILLVAGGVAAIHGRVPRFPRATVIGAALLISGLIAVQATNPRLPSMISFTGPPAAPIAMMTPLGTALQLLVAILFGTAAIVSRDLWRRDHAISDGYVTFGLVLAAFAQVHGAVSPSTHPGPVESGDLLRLAFYVTLLLAIEAEARAVLRTLRRANRLLEELRQTEVDRATLEERSWLSRELHDGLAQDLWLAKLKIGRLTALQLPEEARKISDEIANAIDLGLAEARQAVMALRTAAQPDGTLGQVMARFAQDFEDRFGLRVDFDCDDLPNLPTRTEAELLRIAQEALANARRHADATVVRLRVGCEANRIVMTIADNGRGFDPTATHASAVGLAAMRERASLIGADLDLRSSPGDGTRIIVSAPIMPQAAGLVGVS